MTKVLVNSATVCCVVVVAVMTSLDPPVAITKTLVPPMSLVVIVSSPSSPISVDCLMKRTETVPGAMSVFARLQSKDVSAVAVFPPIVVSENGAHVTVASGAPEAGNVTTGVAETEPTNAVAEVSLIHYRKKSAIFHILAVTLRPAPKLLVSPALNPYDSTGTSPGDTKPLGRVAEEKISEKVTPMMSIWSIVCSKIRDLVCQTVKTGCRSRQ